MTTQPSADRRLGPYVALTVGGIAAALVTGQAALAACAAPAAVLVVLALADRRPLDVRVESAEAPARLLEGDAWTLRVDLSWRGDAVLDVLHTGVRGSRVDGATGWTVDAVDGCTIELRAVAERWGHHDLGRLVIRARRRLGMLRWDSELALDGAVRVLPHAARLDDLLPPRRPRVAAGAHVAPVRGSGTDFADLRPYVPGDRLRDLSWTASARGDQPWVVVHHPERSASVVLLLDAFVEVGAPPGSLDRAARVVWSIAREHLAAGDRIGLLAAGATPTWLSPVSGRRARWQVLDTLLTVGRQVAGADRASRLPIRSRSRQRAIVLPDDAVVLGVSPLQSDAFVATVLHHARLGRPTAMVGVQTTDLVEPGSGHVERAARRLWQAEIDTRLARLSSAGVPGVLVVDDAGPAVRLLADRMHRRPRSAA